MTINKCFIAYNYEINNMTDFNEVLKDIFITIYKQYQKRAVNEKFNKYAYRNLKYFNFDYNGEIYNLRDCLFDKLEVREDIRIEENKYFIKLHKQNEYQSLKIKTTEIFKNIKSEYVIIVIFKNKLGLIEVDEESKPIKIN